MGLDMYLNKKFYVGAEHEHRNVTGNIDIKVGDKKLNVIFNRVSEIIERAGYWRKANAIHKWFVDNVQDGEDDCKEYYVSREDLKKLLNACNKVLANSDQVDVVEQMSNFRELLKLKGHNLVGYDFFEFETDNTYDAVVMNPPLSNNQDIDHVKHAYNFVNDGGMLVSIMSPHWTFANDKKSVEFREWIETQDYFTEHLNGGTFEATGVSSEIVVIHKGA